MYFVCMCLCLCVCFFILFSTKIIYFYIQIPCAFFFLIFITLVINLLVNRSANVMLCVLNCLGLLFYLICATVSTLRRCYFECFIIISVPSTKLRCAFYFSSSSSTPLISCLIRSFIEQLTLAVEQSILIFLTFALFLDQS